MNAPRCSAAIRPSAIARSTTSSPVCRTSGAPAKTDTLDHRLGLDAEPPRAFGAVVGILGLVGVEVPSRPREIGLHPLELGTDDLRAELERTKEDVTVRSGDPAVGDRAIDE